MIDILKKFIFEGRIPYLKSIKRLFFWIAIIAPCSIFFLYQHFGGFAKIGWNMLVAVMVIRPLADVFPQIQIFRSLVTLRREFGIFSGLLLIAHFIGYSISSNLSIIGILSTPSYWDFTNHFAWGLLGLAFAVPVLLTSNRFCIFILKRRWKFIQNLAYVFFFLGGIHVYLVGAKSGLIGLVSVAIFWILAKLNFKIKL